MPPSARIVRLVDRGYQAIDDRPLTKCYRLPNSNRHTPWSFTEFLSR